MIPHSFKIGEFSHKRGKHKYYHCECVCGTKKVISIDQIRGGYVKSCGCLKTKLIAEANRKRTKKYVYELRLAYLKRQALRLQEQGKPVLPGGLLELIKIAEEKYI